MNKSLITLILIITVSCSPKIRSTIISEQKPLKNDSYVLVLEKLDSRQIDGIYIGKIKSQDSGFSLNCSYKEVIEILKNLARSKGGNLIKITKQKSPDLWSTCERVFADLYKVDDIGKYEKQIEWNINRPLKWSDFKGQHKEISSFNKFTAETNSGFQYQTNYVNAFKRPKFFVTSFFNCNLSWVNPGFTKNKELLIHEQGHFDLSEIYARKLEKKLNNANLKMNNIVADSKHIYEEVYLEFSQEQIKYDNETTHGSILEKQEKWNKYFNSVLRPNN